MARSDSDLTDADRVQRLADELAELSAQDFGATSESIDSLTEVLRELGASVLVRHPEQGDPARAARWHLLRVFDGLDNPDHRYAIDGGLGLTVTAKSRAGRYRELSDRVKTTMVGKTIDRERENGFKVFARRLISLATEDAAAPASAFPTVRSQGYVVERSTMRVRFKPGARVERFIMEQTVKAITPGNLVYLARNEYFADGRANVFDVVPLFGCELVGDQTDEHGVHFAQLRLKRDVVDGSSYSLMYELVVTTDAPMTPIAMVTAPSDGMVASFKLDFADDEQPSSVWTFEVLDILDVKNEELRTQREHPLNGNSYFEFTHRKLKRASCSGVTWRWT